MTKHSKTALLIVFAVLTSFSQFSVNIILPMSESLAYESGVSLDAISTSVSTFFLFLAASQLVFGYLTDDAPPLTLLLIGLSFFISGTLVLGIADTAIEFHVARCLHGIGAGAAVAIPRGTIPHFFAKERQSNAYLTINLAYFLAPGVSMGVGLILATYGSQTKLAAVVGFVTAVSFVWCVISIPRSPTTLELSSFFEKVTSRTMSVVRSVVFVKYAIGAGFIAAIFPITIAELPPVIEKLDLGWLKSGSYIAFALITPISITSLKYFRGVSSDVVLVRVSLIILALMAGIGFVQGYAENVVLMIVTFLAVWAFGCVAVTHAMATLFINSDNNGGATSGLFGFAQMLLGALGGYVCYGVGLYGVDTPIVWVVAGASLSAAVIVFLAMKQSSEEAVS